MEPTCAQHDCDERPRARGLCERHYAKAYREGRLSVRDRREPVQDVDVDAMTCTCPLHGPGVRLRVRQRKHSVSYACRVCERGGRPRRPETVRASRIRAKYGISAEEVDLRIAAQQGLCLICQDPLEQPAIDHDHDKGHVRGILCRGCNVGLGFFRDNPKSLERAAKYVRRYRDAG